MATMLERLLRYEELKLQAKEMEEEMAILNEQILAAMVEQGAEESPQLKAGKIFLQKRKSWKFSDAHTNLKAELTALEEKEKANGTAAYTENPFIAYKKT